MSDDNCLDVEDPRGPVNMFVCHPFGGNMAWTYDVKTLAIKHPKTGRCLDNLIMKKHLVLRPCSGRRGQQWLFQDNFPWHSRLHIESLKKNQSALPSHDNVEIKIYKNLSIHKQ